MDEFPSMLKGAVLHPHARLLEACRLRAVLTAAPGREREVERGRERSREREREVEREREGGGRQKMLLKCEMRERDIHTPKNTQAQAPLGDDIRDKLHDADARDNGGGAEDANSRVVYRRRNLGRLG